MFFEKASVKAITCPHLKGSREGAICSAANDFVRSMAGVDIKFCMSKHFEICHIYRNAVSAVNNRG